MDPTDEDDVPVRDFNGVSGIMDDPEVKAEDFQQKRFDT